MHGKLASTDASDMTTDSAAYIQVVEDTANAAAQLAQDLMASTGMSAVSNGPSWLIALLGNDASATGFRLDAMLGTSRAVRTLR